MAIDPSDLMTDPNTNVYESNFISSGLMHNRPFYDGLAVSAEGFSNCNVLSVRNCGSLRETIPNIMPFETATGYKMKYHRLPMYL